MQTSTAQYSPEQPITAQYNPFAAQLQPSTSQYSPSSLLTLSHLLPYLLFQKPHSLLCLVLLYAIKSWVKNVPNYAIYGCKILGLKIRVYKKLDEYHIWLLCAFLPEPAIVGRSLQSANSSPSPSFIIFCHYRQNSLTVAISAKPSVSAPGAWMACFELFFKRVWTC